MSSGTAIPRAVVAARVVGGARVDQFRGQRPAEAYGTVDEIVDGAGMLVSGGDEVTRKHDQQARTCRRVRGDIGVLLSEARFHFRRPDLTPEEGHPGHRSHTGINILAF